LIHKKVTFVRFSGEEEDGLSRNDLSGIQKRILVACLMFVVLVSALFAFRAWQIRDEARAEAIHGLSNQTRVLKVFVEESFGGVEAQLRVIATRVRAAGDFNAEEIRDIGIVFNIRRGSPSYLDNMVVANAAGTVLFTAHDGSRRDLADQDYFATHRGNSDSGTRFGPIERARADGPPYFTMSRRLETRDGQFAGVVVAYIDVEALAREFDRLRTHPESSLALIAADGTLVTRAPYSPDFVGQAVLYPRRTAGGRKLSGDADSVVFHRPNALDGISRLIAQSRLDRYPFTVGTTITESAAFARWRREWPQLALVWSLVTLATVAGGLMLARQAKRTREAREAFSDASRDLDFYKYALDHHAIVGITDPSGRIVHANDKFCEISKYAREELIGRNHRILNSGLHSKEFFRDLWRTIGRGEIWRGEIRNRAKDGSLYWVDTAIVPLMDTRGKPFRYFAIRIDISHRKRMEEDLIAAKTEAEAANRFKGELLANTSHELRTPLNAVIGFSEIMKTEAFGPLPPRYRDYAADIHTAGRHLLRLVNDILDVSAIDAGKLELHEETLDLTDLLKGVIRLIRHRAEAGMIDLREDIAEGLPRLFADERRVKQIALNLLSNAIKFNAPGGSVTLAAGKAADESLFFRVADNGIGMDENEVAVAMSKFGQVDSSLARKHEGTGLGLPLAKSLAELHGGRLSIESAKGQGTTVTVTFPPKRTVGWS
jgi:PAS domain S-box-containing protein